MKAFGSACIARGPAAGGYWHSLWVPLARYPQFQRCAVLSFATLILLLGGCATKPGESSKASSGPGLAESPTSPFGIIAISDECSPAAFSYQKGKGKLGSATAAIVDSATVGLSAPGAGVMAAGAVLSAGGCSDTAGDPRFYVAMAGAVGGVALVGVALAGPVVGAEGLIRSLKKVSPRELAEREAALTNALREMAAQQPFRDALMQTWAEKIPGGTLLPESKNSLEGTGTYVDAILEASVDQLCLERGGSSEGSYFLHIKTHARLVRVSDGAVCFEQNAEYRSEKALFLDWTMAGAIQGVAETGYQELAGYYVSRLLRVKPNVKRET